MKEYLQEALTGLAQRGLKARFVACPDACPACRKLHGRVFEPLEAPLIPVQRCLTPPCRCRYEGCDPRSTIESLMKAGIAAVNEERLGDAKELLYQVIDLDERNEKAWLWLSAAVTGTDERIICLENVLVINPDHEVARDALTRMLAERRELGPGQSAARKIKVAREAIGHIKARQERIVPSRDKPPLEIVPASEQAVPEHAARKPPVEEPMMEARPVKEPVKPAKEKKPPMRFVSTALLLVVLAILIVVLVLVAVRYAGVL
jgi:hypothetical protein